MPELYFAKKFISFRIFFFESKRLTFVLPEYLSQRKICLLFNSDRVIVFVVLNISWILFLFNFTLVKNDIIIETING